MKIRMSGNKKYAAAKERRAQMADTERKRTNKTELRFFTILEWKKEEKYLQKRHSEGWKFIGVTFPGLYHFEACEPEDVVYQLDYNQEGAAHREEYIQMFHDCGWEYILDFAGYSYFRKPVSAMDGSDPEEIFCDDDSRADMMKRVFRGRMIPLIVIFLGIIIPQLFSQSHTGGTFGMILTGAYVVLFVLYLVLFAWYGWQFRQYMKRLKK